MYAVNWICGHRVVIELSFLAALHKMEINIVTSVIWHALCA